LNQTGFTLSLADGTSWCIIAGDEEAARVVAALSAAMNLQRGATGRKLLVTTGRDRIPAISLNGAVSVVCSIFPPISNELLVMDMVWIALFVVREIQSRGGVLVHGALAEYPFASLGREKDCGLGEGILLAGSFSVGKTTASYRLTAPWRSLCDDATLVVRDRSGRYWAHPWPTWSRFYGSKDGPGPGGNWDVQRPVPLRAIFFLSKSPDDDVEPLPAASAMAMLMEAVQHVSNTMTFYRPEEEIQAIYRDQLAAVEALAHSIPAYTLKISLNGEFWKKIERVLQADERNLSQPITRFTNPSLPIAVHNTTESDLNDGTPYIVYSGLSMYPTLREPDLLEVEPYNGRSIRCGDVIYFHPPENKRRVVHRVIRVSPLGIRTRGDNNRQEDLDLLQPGDIFGKVLSAQKGPRRRRIAGGRIGVMVGYWCWLRFFINKYVSRLTHGAYSGLAKIDLFRYLLPNGLRYRVFIFRSHKRYFIRLILGKRVIGTFNTKELRWRIRRPFRLFVNEDALPPRNPIVALNRKIEKDLEPMANPAVVCRELPNAEAVLINLDSGASIALNHTSFMIWQLSDSQRTVEQIGAAIQCQFRDAPASVLDDVRELLQIMVEDGFIGFEWTSKDSIS
jgi:SynChlorMet cassette protein ScmC